MHGGIKPSHTLPMRAVGVPEVTLTEPPTAFRSPYMPRGWDLYCSPCRLHGPTYRSPPHISLQEVMWLVSRGGYSENLLTISAPIVFHQRFETKTLRYESQCSSTEVSWDLYIKGGDIVFNAKGKANEIGQSWCPADLLDFQLPTTGTSQRPPIDPMQTPASEIGSIKGKIHFFHIIFLNKDISITMLDNAIECCMALLHIHCEGCVSQIIYLGLSLYFMLLRK